MPGYRQSPLRRWLSRRPRWIGGKATAVVETGTPNVKISGSFAAKPVKWRTAGSFTTKPMKVRVGGVWYQV